MNDWISNLKAGDFVIVNNGGWGHRQIVQSVKRITPAGNVDVNGVLFDKRGFVRGGGSYNDCYLSEYTDAAAERIRIIAFVSAAADKAQKLLSTRRLPLSAARGLMAATNYNVGCEQCNSAERRAQLRYKIPALFCPICGRHIGEDCEEEFSSYEKEEDNNAST